MRNSPVEKRRVITEETSKEIRNALENVDAKGSGGKAFVDGYRVGGKTGTACPRLVEFVDLYPTLTDLCGLPQAPGMEGLSFAPLLKNPQMKWKKAAYTMVIRQGGKFGHSVVTERYRYTEWDGGKAGVEFYDHETDPNEWTNLAWPSRTRDAKTSARLEDMRKLLHADQLANAR